MGSQTAEAVQDFMYLESQISLTVESHTEQQLRIVIAENRDCFGYHATSLSYMASATTLLKLGVHHHSAGSAIRFWIVDCHKTGPRSPTSFSHEMPKTDSGHALAGSCHLVTNPETHLPHRTSDNSSRPKGTTYLDMLFTYLLSFHAKQFWVSPRNISMVRRIPGEGQGSSRVPRGWVSWKEIQWFQLLHPGVALWTVNCGGRTQRPLPATLYDDDDVYLKIC